MSLAMSRSRPSLPALNSDRLPSLAAFSTSQSGSLPPLSALLNHDNNITESSYTTTSTSNTVLSPGSMPTSPSNVTEQSAMKLQRSTTLPAPALTMKTPVKLPSFDSLKFNTESKPIVQHSKSFSGASSLVTHATPASITSFPTPVSHQVPPSAIRELHPEPVSGFRVKVGEVQDSPLVEKRSFAFISHSPSTFPSHEPAIDNAQLARRKRRRTSPGELAVLQAEFGKGSTPNRARREEIANKVNMTEKAVQIWFQNRRQALRRQSKDDKEVHHIDRLYTVAHSPVGVPEGIATGPSPFGHPQPPMVFASPYPVAHHHQPVPVITQGPSSPPNSSSPAPAQASSSSPNLSSNNVLITPSRPPRDTPATTAGTGSTMTFRLTSEKTTPGKTMTPMTQTTRLRQKPLMKVNYQPTSSPVNSSPIGKENVSPQSSPVKTKGEDQPLRQLQSPKRVPLGQLAFNGNVKPKDNDAVATLLNLNRH